MEGFSKEKRELLLNKTVDEEHLNSFYKIYSKLPVVKQKLFNDPDEYKCELAEVYFINDLEFNHQRDKAIGNNFTFNNARKFFTELERRYQFDNIEFVRWAIQYFHVNINKNNNLIEFSKILIQSKIIHGVANLFETLVLKCDSYNKENDVLHVNAVCAFFLHVFLLQMSDLKNNKQFNKVFDSLNRNICRLLVVYLNKKLVALDIRKLINLLKITIIGYIGNLSDAYEQKKIKFRQFNSIKQIDLPKRTIKFLDNKNKINYLSDPLLFYTKTALKSCAVTLDIPIYTSHHYFEKFINDPTVNKDLNKILNKLNIRHPFYEDLDETLNKIDNSFLHSKDQSTNKITDFFQAFIIGEFNIIKLLYDVLIQFESERLNRWFMNKYTKIGLNFEYVKDHPLFKNKDSKFPKLKSFNLDSFSGENYIYSDDTLAHRINFIINEAQRYRNVIFNDSSYVILLIAKHLKYNKSFQYLSYLKNLQNTRLIEIFLHYISDTGSKKNRIDYMNTVELLKSTHCDSSQESQEEHICQKGQQSLDLYRETRKNCIVDFNERPQSSIDVDLEKKTDYLLSRSLRKINLIGNILDITSSMCKHSLLFAQYLKCHYLKLIGDLMNDFKAQKIIYYVPQIFLFFVCLPSAITKTSLEYDQVFLRDSENYSIGVEYYRNYQKNPEFQIISKYPNPYKLLSPNIKSILDSQKYDIENPIFKKKLKQWEEIYLYTNNHCDPSDCNYFTDFNLTENIQKRCQSLSLR